jgi:hypothetical protein
MRPDFAKIGFRPSVAHNPLPYMEPWLSPEHVAINPWY